MSKRVVIPGKAVQGERPEWEPLIAIAEELVGEFMWMFEVAMENGDSVHAYKHSDTRRYLHLGESGTAYRYLGDGSYEGVDLAGLLDEALSSWRHLGAIAGQLAVCERVIARAERR